MREIKFRVWLNGDYFVTAKMIDWETALQEFNAFDIFQSPDKMTPLQFTGLFDKNGREIYESDILRVTTGEDGESYVATVKWFGDKYYPAFDLEGIPEECDYYANALAAIFNSGIETCEVIGNIFENQELLEDK